MKTLAEYLYEQNPWWSGEYKDDTIERPLYLEKIQAMLQTPEILVIGGVRRSGKTTLMRQTINRLIRNNTARPEEILFVSCDSAEVQSLASPLEDILDTYKKESGISDGIWIFLDEIQMVENFPQTLKKWRDLGKYHLIISGSSSYLLESKTGSMLSGRYLSLTVYPLGFSEYLQFRHIALPKKNLDAQGRKYEFISCLRRYLTEGGFPALVFQTDEAIRKDYLEAYYDSIIFRDVLSNNPVRNRVTMEALYSYLLSNIAAPQNYTSLAKQFSCDYTRIRDYIQYAEEGWLFYVVKHFSYSLKKQNASSKKVYVVDTGLRSAASFVFSKDTGRLAENVVMMELKRRGFSPMYWLGSHEVDFVLKDDENELLLINVCYSSEIPERETRGFEEFARMYPDILKKYLLLTEDVEGEINGFPALPLWKWLIGMEK
ncbi:MAG TPA: ATP-binding protein [Methanocorpusculum sp.]|nr:ATP-binding protein [Methanocorpusculum sp.]